MTAAQIFRAVVEATIIPARFATTLCALPETPRKPASFFFAARYLPAFGDHLLFFLRELPPRLRRQPYRRPAAREYPVELRIDFSERTVLANCCDLSA